MVERSGTSGGRRQVWLVHRHGTEPALPQMARPAVAGIDEAGVAAMGIREGAPQPVLVGRHDDQVDVVGHEAIGPDLDYGDSLLNAPNCSHGAAQRADRSAFLTAERKPPPVRPTARQ